MAWSIVLLEKPVLRVSNSSCCQFQTGSERQGFRRVKQEEEEKKPSMRSKEELGCGLQKTTRDRSRGVLSDESNFQRFPPRGRVTIRRGPGEATVSCTYREIFVDDL